MILNFFAGVSYSPTENLEEIEDLIKSAPNEGFNFSEVTLNEVILTVAHFKS